MPYTSLLGLSLPTTGSLSGTWGDEVNNAITSLLDTSVAGTTTLSTDADVTLTSTDGVANQARSAVLLWTAGGSVTRNITAPARSKAYVVINATSGSQSIVIRGSGPTAGVTVIAGRKALVAWNGTDFVEVAGGLVNLASGVTGTLPVANGGTGATTLTGILKGSGTSAFTAVTAPTGTIVGTTDTQTLTNKRVTPRVSSTASITSPLAWNSDNFDEYAATAQAVNLTLNADAGTPTDGQKIIFRFKDNGTARTLTWTTGTSKSFRAVGVTLPTTTVASKTVYVGCIYNNADTRWDAVAVVQEA